MIERGIVAVHEESVDTCIVELDCGHRRHVRDRPPFERHPWVRDAAARGARVGQRIECGRCEALERPVTATRYREGPIWDQQTVPRGLLAAHRLKPGVWGELTILEGRVRLRYLPPLDRVRELGSGDTASIPPELPHQLELTGDVRLRLDFWR
jgi:tellurite methyltransferase